MKRILSALVVTLALVGVVAAVPSVSAIDVFGGCGGAGADTAVCKAANNDKILGSGGLLNRIVNIMLAIIGIISVIMIIVGGLRYVLSGGDSGAISGAKDTILYAIIGLVVAIMAYAIVNFVLGML